MPGIAGILLFLPSAPASGLRQWSIVFGAAGLALLIAGPVVRLPLRSTATLVTRAGLLACGAAIVWFVVVFPAGWSVQTGNQRVIGLYALGLGVIAVGGVAIPLLTDATADADDRTARLERDRAAERSARGASERERDAAREAAARDAETAAAERDRFEAELAALRTSQARVELYEDRGGKWRWRLRHRNGNVLADSGEGYASWSGARDGIASVKRGAPNAAG